MEDVKARQTVGTILTSWRADGYVYLAVRVDEDGAPADYVGSVREEELAKLTVDEQKRALVEAVRLERDRRRARDRVDLSGLTGEVVL